MLRTKDIPNVLTVMRLLLVVPIIMCLATGRYQLAVVLFVVAGLSDGLDGFLARRFGWISRFGEILDPIADRLLFVSLFVVLTLIDAIPLWFAMVILTRDLLLMAGAVLIYAVHGVYRFKPSLLGKISTLFQIIMIFMVMLQLEMNYAEWPQVFMFMMTLVIFLSITSGIGYVWKWLYKVKQLNS